MYTTPPLWRDLVEISTRKLWHTSTFSLEGTDFKNVIFEKNPWGHRVQTAQNNENSKWKLMKIRWNPKFGLRDLKNGLLTSRISEEAQWIFPKYTFFRSGQSTEKN